MTDEEVRAFIEAIRPVKVSDDGPYKKLDCYRDFHAVFSTPQGQTVLNVIMDRCDPADRLMRESEAGDTAKLIWRAAERSVFMWIAATAFKPPKAIVQERRPPVRG